VKNLYYRLSFGVLASTFALAGCGSSSSSSSVPPAQANVRVRFAEAAPELETLENGVPQDIGLAYLQVDGKTVASSFNYGTFTPFVTLGAGGHSLVARDEAGYAVGPLPTPSLSAGASYTLILVGTYPNYSVLAFTEPAKSTSAQLSFYEASPTVPQSAFGSFRASSRSEYKQLGSAKLGEIETVTLGKRVSDFGGYVGSTTSRLGSFTPSQIDAFDTHNALPFHAVSRLSLFLFDPKSGSSIGPVFGSLDE
jgi:hypothetical protein